MTDPQQPLRAALLAPVVILALFLAGCLAPVTSLTALATKAEQVERAEKAKAYDDLSVKALNFKSSAESKQAWADAMHLARRAAYAKLEDAMDAKGTPDGKYDAKKTSEAYKEVAAGVRKAGK